MEGCPVTTACLDSLVEKLIKELPSMLADLSNGDLNSAEKDHLSNGISFQHTENGTNPREAQSMLLERIASEMNRLKFYITHAQVYLAVILMLTLLAFLWFLHLSYNFFATISQLLLYHSCANNVIKLSLLNAVDDMLSEFFKIYLLIFDFMFLLFTTQVVKVLVIDSSFHLQTVTLPKSKTISMFFWSLSRLLYN
ncbi:uncharacterized protein LOC114313438 isoform X1 [Camellia sinensis]|uniref:uncharacterized protein LOC114313438 isoform X1 n=1 Tax=Camellia sinensis TaxID=4442 RepID=UPI001035F0F8|nr:uncharacterized protein LOC114313438 isoform X1 [Camellia sinensis]